VNNAVDRVHVVAEPARRKPYVNLDEDEISGVLEEGGKLSASYPATSAQESNSPDARRDERLERRRRPPAEAGTGVGKSFAYLVPPSPGR